MQQLVFLPKNNDPIPHRAYQYNGSSISIARIKDLVKEVFGHQTKLKPMEVSDGYEVWLEDKEIASFKISDYVVLYPDGSITVHSEKSFNEKFLVDKNPGKTFGGSEKALPL